MSDPSEPVGDTSSFGSYLTLFIFLITIIGILTCINKDITLRIKNKTIKISYLYPPVLGCLLLLITVRMTPMDMIHAVIGEGTVKPYTIILLVISISLVCISLDFTGAISFISWKLISKFATTKLRLFTLVYIISTCFSVLTSNDVVVMTMTPLVMYCAQFAKIKPLPYLIASFYAANLSGMFFVVGNPTNIIIAQALGINFADYFAYMVIPALCCCTLGFICLVVVSRHELGLHMEDLIPIPIVQYWLHRFGKWREARQREHELAQNPDRNLSDGGQNDGVDDMDTGLDGLDSNNINTIITSPSKGFLPPSQSFQFPGTKAVDEELIAMDQGVLSPTLSHSDSKYMKEERTLITLPVHDANDELRDPRGAIYQGLLLLLCLIVMAVSSFIYDKIEIWMVSCGCCVLSFIYDVIRYPLMPRSHSSNFALGETTVSEAQDGNLQDGMKKSHISRRKYKALNQSSSSTSSTSPSSTIIQTSSLSPSSQNSHHRQHDGGDNDNDDDSNDDENLKLHRGVFSGAGSSAIFAQKRQPTPTISTANLFSSAPSTLHNNNNNPSSLNQSQTLLFSSGQQSPTLSRPLSPSAPVDPFAISLEAVDDVTTHPDLHTSLGNYTNPFTQDEYELIDINPNDNTNNNNPTSRTVTVRTDFVPKDGHHNLPNNAPNTAHGLNDRSVGTDRELCVLNILKALPYDAPIFVCSMFILVKSLVKSGWVDTIARAMINMVGGLEDVGYVFGAKSGFVKPDYITIEYLLNTSTAASTSTLFRLSFAFGILTLLLCNLMNNQPATILVTYVLLRCNVIISNYQLGSNLLPIITSSDSSQPEIFPTDVIATGLHPWYLKVMAYAAIAASNYSAIVTLVASLAGIIFANIVKMKLDGTAAELEAEITINNHDAAHKDDLIAELNALKTQYISYTQFTTRGVYIVPFIYLSVSLVIVGAVFYA